MSFRLLPDGRLRVPDGKRLNPQYAWLTQADARKRVREARYVVHDAIDDLTEITTDRTCLTALLGRVTSDASDVGARLYRGDGVDAVLLIESC